MNPSRFSSSFLRLLLFVSLSLGLMTLEQRSDGTGILRLGAALAVRPVQDIASLPGVVGDWVSLFADSRVSLYEEKERLRVENLVLQSRLQTLRARVRSIDVLRPRG